jgi:hypothetical protein
MEPEYNFSQGKRGAIDPIEVGKIRITIRLDDKVLDNSNSKVGDCRNN